MLKTLKLNVFSTKFPFLIKIFSSNGLLIFKKFVVSNSTKICVCTHSKMLVVAITHLNVTKKHYVCLFNIPCQEQNIWSNFNTNTPQIQQFFLHDQNYGLPVANAILKFF